MPPKRIVRDAVGWLRAFLAVVVRPRLWWVAARQAARIARAHWWRRAPFLPLPDAEYLRFRLETAYGEVTAPRPADLVGYLEWCATTAHPGHGLRR
jgi:hypothetical protein